MGPIVPRDARLSDSGCEFFQSGTARNVTNAAKTAAMFARGKGFWGKKEKNTISG